MDAIRVVAVQCRAGDPLPTSPPDEWRGADLVAFPEYWRCGPSHLTLADAASAHDDELARATALSQALDAVVIAGTLVTPLDAQRSENRAYVIDRGVVAGHYAKVHPMPGEVRRGIVPGAQFRAFDVASMRIAVLVCSDVLSADSFPAIAGIGVDVVVIPTSSPYRAADTIEEKFARDRDIFVAGAATAGAYVVKVCTLGPMFGERLQGRSLIAAPWGVLARVPPEDEDVPFALRADLDLRELRAWRERTAWRAASIGARVRIERRRGAPQS